MRSGHRETQPPGRSTLGVAMMQLRLQCKRLVACLPLILATMSGCKAVQAERIALMQMQAAGDGLVVVGHIPDELTGEQGLGRIGLMDTKGVIHHKLDERTVFAIEGITPDVIWVTRKTATNDLSANAIDTLAPKAGITEALDGHPVLSTAYDVLGTHDGKAVLQGADSRSYTIDATGAVAKLPEGATVSKPATTTGGKRDQVRLNLEPIPKKGSDRNVKIHAELDNPSLFSDSAAVLGKDSPDILVQSTAFATGSVSSQLSRVAASGEVLWNATLADLAAPVAVADAELKLVALTPLGDATWLLIRASKTSRQQQTDYYEVEHRLVRLDASNGKAAEAHTVKTKG